MGYGKLKRKTRRREGILLDAAENAIGPIQEFGD